MKTEHTPLPWHYDSIDQIRSKNGTVIARCERRERHEYMDSREQSANARFIARACNAHDELVAALEDLMSCHSDYAERDKHEMNAAYEALAKAKGEE